MCNHCNDGVCTNRCAFEGIYPNYNLQLLSLESQLAAVRANIRTAGEHQRFTKLMQNHIDAPAMVLATTQPSGVKTYITPLGEEAENQLAARVYFNNRQARQTALVQCAEVEVV